MPSLFIEKQIELEHATISYLEARKASTSVPILFLHGWGVDIEPYQESLEILSERYHIIAPYLPGLGPSTASRFVENYSDYAELILDFVNLLNLKSVHIIGHSLGGAIGMALAALKPSIAHSLIIVDSTGIPIGSVPEVLLRRVIEMSAQINQIKPQPVLAILKSLLYNSLFHPQRVIQMAWLVMEQDIRPLLPKIQSPCLILWGLNDLLTPITCAQKFSQAIKGSKLIVVDGGYHEWNLFFADKFTTIISNFIDEIEQTN